MSRRSKVLLAVAAGAVIAVSATVVAVGGNGNSGPVETQLVESNGKAEAGKNWKPVPGLLVASTQGFLSVNVSAQMTKGKARFRIAPIGGGPAIPPGPVLFSAKAANSFTWSTSDTCGQGDQHQVQWKRSGKGDAVAAKLSSIALFDLFCL